MTNQPLTIGSASRVLGLEMMDHLRIRTMIVDGEIYRARDLLFDRMKSMLNSYAEEGTAAGPDEFLAALNLLNSSFGPQVMIEMRRVATELCEEFHNAIPH